MRRSRVLQPGHIAGRKFNPNKDRDNLYDRHWSAYRAIYLNVNTHCYCCLERSTVVDHLIPHKGDFHLFWRIDNYLPLCKGCHDEATNLFDRNYRPGEPITNKAEWMRWRRARNEITRKVKVVPFGGDLMAWITEKKAAMSKKENDTEQKVPFLLKNPVSSC